jgi:2-polyprenyl-3-methyl-5-hydroxy-6-metoxy-1,4-benzoquinol methylase
MIFSDVRFDDREIERLYVNYRGEDYCRIRETYEPGYTKINQKIGKDGNQIRKKFIEHIILNGDISKVRSVLDYGGDQGQLIPKIFAGANRYVFDISGVAPINGVKSVTAVEVAAPYDLIMCCGVLEHVSFPAKLLELFKGLLTKHGYLYVEVPAGIPTRRYFDLMLGRKWLNTFWRPRMHEHINYFTNASLRNTLLLHGFSPLISKIAILDLGWCVSPVIGSLAISRSAKKSVKYGTLNLLLEGIEYGIKRKLLSPFGRAT